MNNLTKPFIIYLKFKRLSNSDFLRIPKLFSIILLIIYFVVNAELCFAQISRTQIINNASSFVTFSWTANTCNLWSGTYCGNRYVYAATPANSTQRGWVKVGTNISMPYAWGGSSTTAQHISAMSSCKSAGDICSAGSVVGSCKDQGLIGAGLSCASGLDCSGLVTKAWAMSQSHLGTGELPSFASEIPLSQMQPGDIFNIVGDHTMLFKSKNPDGSITVIETSGRDWRTSTHTFYDLTELETYKYLCPKSSIVIGGCGSVSAPSNDNCAGAVQFPTLQPGTCVGVTSGEDVSGATQSLAPHQCSGYTSLAAMDVWFKFTAINSSHTIQLSSLNNFDAVTEIRLGPSCNGSYLDCYDPSGSPTTINYSYNNFEPGQTYYIRVFDYGSTQPAVTTFNICINTPSSSNCTINSFDPSSINRNPESFASTSGEDIIINAQPNCSFSVTESCSWLTVTPMSGTTNSVGQAFLNYTLQANTSTSSRSCTVNVNGSSFTITQAGCTFDFYPSTKSVLASGSTYNLDIDSYSPCSWSIQNSCSWVHLSQTNGTGDPTIAVTVDANPLCEQRTCTLIISPGNATHVITQQSNGTSSTAPTGASASPTSICSGNSTTLTRSGGSLGAGASWIWYSGSCGGTSVGSGSSISISPTTTTTYYVRAEGGTCDITTACASVTVTVNASSTAPTGASASPASICSGNSITLTRSSGSLGAGASWRWYSGSCGGTSEGSGSSISVSPTTTTTYYVRAEGGSCNITTECASVTVTVNSSSTAPTSVSASPTSICSGNSTTLTRSGGSLGTGASWRWYSGSCGGTSEGSGSSISVSPTSTTTYYVRTEGTCNITSCANVTVTVNICTGIVDIQHADISVYPNPVSGMLNIEYKNDNYETINILNSQGGLLAKEKAITPQQQLDFTGFEAGLYILEFIKSSGEISKVKVIKNK